MEYSPSGHFVNEPSLFAIHRDIALTDEESAAIHITVGPTDVVIDTGRIVLTYHADGKPFGAQNLHGLIRCDANNRAGELLLRMGFR